MAFFQWFDAEELDEFARSIAAELVKRALRSAGCAQIDGSW
jgi:hypothetical protein